MVTDLTKARQYYKMGCDAGIVADCFSLGRYYHRGLSIPKDVPLTVQLYQRACDGGVGAACHDLAVMHEFGEGGLRRDRQRMNELFKQGCAAGDQRACGKVRRGP
jgi:TPR repeat protein